MADCQDCDSSLRQSQIHPTPYQQAALGKVESYVNLKKIQKGLYILVCTPTRYYDGSTLTDYKIILTHI